MAVQAVLNQFFEVLESYHIKLIQEELDQLAKAQLLLSELVEIADGLEADLGTYKDNTVLEVESLYRMTHDPHEKEELSNATKRDKRVKEMLRDDGVYQAMLANFLKAKKEARYVEIAAGHLRRKHEIAVGRHRVLI